MADLPGVANTGVVNDPTPVLVQDLDIKVTNSSGETTATFLPWKLTSVNTNEKGDNIVDPYERVDIENASGEYTITISHKGTLKRIARIRDKSYLNPSHQDLFTSEKLPVSVIISPEKEVAKNVLRRLEIPGAIENIPFVDDKLKFLAVKIDSDCPIIETEISESETTTTFIQLTVLHAFSGEEVVRISPENGLTGTTTTKIDFSWENYNNAETYLIEVSESPSFNTILLSSDILIYNRRNSK